VKFIDEAIITVQSGDGGRGCVSFRREKFIPHGGPDGGDGGKGGDVVFKTASQKRTLYQFRYTKQLRAQNGGHGQGRQKTGRNGKDLIIEIPPGTIIADADTGQLIKDCIQTGETHIAAHGGRGGQGNKRFATSTNRTPKFAQPGEPGQTLRLKLELKLLADAGIIGLPNAGKSTLLGIISSAHPKVGDYPFTTLTPTLGVVQANFGEPFTVADIPGLIEGAHDGSGLGVRFLKHIERTRILIHLIDVTTIDSEDPLQSSLIINRELALYSQELAKKPQIVVLNKLDVTGADKAADLFCSAFTGDAVVRISAATGRGVEDLKARIVNLLDETTNN